MQMVAFNLGVSGTQCLHTTQWQQLYGHQMCRGDAAFLAAVT